MDQKQIITRYFQALEKTSYENVISLFAKDAIVHSPFYGKIAVREFFQKLFTLTTKLKINVKDIFVSLDNPKVSAAHFYADWTLENGDSDSLELVDIFEFSDDFNQIVQLTIIYNSPATTKTLQELSSKS